MNLGPTTEIVMDETDLDELIQELEAEVDVESLDSPYMRNLLCRNWFQVKNADAVFAIGKGLIDLHTVEGGTGWAIQMAIDSDKPVHLYLQSDMGGGWLRYMPVVGFERRWDELPILTENFAGIGTRAINKYGIDAIRRVYEQSICQSEKGKFS